MSHNLFLKVKDHLVSNKEFDLVYDSDLDMLITQPQPQSNQLAAYYKSENYISHSDGNNSLFERAYQFVKSTSLKRKLKLINSFKLKGNEILDIGCGTGDFLEIAQNNNWVVTGVEPNKKARTLANSKTGNRIFNENHLSTLNDHKFDVITLWHVLEHLPNLNEQLLKIKKLLKPDGKLIVAVPNFKSFDASYYKEYWAAYDVPRHLWHFSQNTIDQLFQEINMKVEQKIPMKYDAYYVSLLSEKYKAGWMNIFSAFFIGSRSNLAASRSGEYSSLTYVISNIK